MYRNTRYLRDIYVLKYAMFTYRNTSYFANRLQSYNIFLIHARKKYIFFHFPPFSTLFPLTQAHEYINYFWYYTVLYPANS